MHKKRLESDSDKLKIMCTFKSCALQVLFCFELQEIIDGCKSNLYWSPIGGMASVGWWKLMKLAETGPWRHLHCRQWREVCGHHLGPKCGWELCALQRKYQQSFHVFSFRPRTDGEDVDSFWFCKGLQWPAGTRLFSSAVGPGVGSA